MEGLSLTAARPRARRATIARAGTRIVSVDPRYARIDVERAANTAAGYRLRAVRRERPAEAHGRGRVGAGSRRAAPRPGTAAGTRGGPAAGRRSAVA